MRIGTFLEKVLKYLELAMIYLAFAVSIVLFLLLTCILCIIAIAGVVLLIGPGIIALIWLMIAILCGAIYEKIEKQREK